MPQGFGTMQVKTDYIPGRPRLAVDHCGSGPLVVFMHGIGGNRTNWRDQLPDFGARYHAMAWDARGYGLSDDYDGPLDFGAFAADLLRLLDHFGAEKAFLIGLSMGGRIAQDFYPRHPDRVAAMVLCDTMPSFNAGLTPEQRAEFIRLRKEPLVNGKEPKDIAPVVARTLLSKNAPDWAFDRLVESMAMLHKGSYIKTVEATTHYDRVDLPNIKVPVLLVFGSEDRLTTPEVGRSMAAAIPDADLFIVENAGHLPNIEKPREFNAKVLTFLDAHRGLAT
jgi:3-oxoadipate enol-lactonase